MSVGYESATAREPVMETGVLDCSAYVITEGCRPIVAVIETPRNRLPVEDEAFAAALMRMLGKDRRTGDWMSVDSLAQCNVHWTKTIRETETATDRGTKINFEREYEVDQIQLQLRKYGLWAGEEKCSWKVVDQFNASPDVVDALREWLIDEINR